MDEVKKLSLTEATTGEEKQGYEHAMPDIWHWHYWKEPNLGARSEKGRL